METSKKQLDARHDNVAGLRELADFLEANPELMDYMVMPTFYVFPYGGNALFARLALTLGNARKSVSGSYYNVERDFGPITLQVTASRERVCERVVVGTEEVEVTEPDPEAVAALPTVTRIETVEKVEWVCPPSLHDLAGA